MRDESAATSSSYPIDLKRFGDSVAAEFANQTPERALKLISSRSVIPAGRFRDVGRKSLELIAAATDSYGPVQDCELFLVEAIGTSVYRFSYLLRFQKFAARVSLTFLGDGDSYVVTDYHLSQDLHGFFRTIAAQDSGDTLHNSDS